MPPTREELEAAARQHRMTRQLADELADLRSLAADLPSQVAEQALAYLELEQADASGKLKFGLSDQERAAAELLRRDRDYRRDLYATVDAVTASKPKPDRDVSLSEDPGPIYTHIDSHGTRLLCFDDRVMRP